MVLNLAAWGWPDGACDLQPPALTKDALQLKTNFSVCHDVETVRKRCTGGLLFLS